MTANNEELFAIPGRLIHRERTRNIYRDRGYEYDHVNDIWYVPLKEAIYAQTH